MDITQATTPTASNHHALPIIDEIGQHLVSFSITNNGATGNGQHEIFPFSAMHLLTRPGLASTSLEIMFIAVIDQRVEIVRCLKVDTATTSAIATIRATKGSKFLTAEMHGAIATISSLNINFCMIK